MIRSLLLASLFGLGLLSTCAASAQQRAVGDDNIAAWKDPKTGHTYSDCERGRETLPRPKLNGKDVCHFDNFQCLYDYSSDDYGYIQKAAFCYPNPDTNRCPGALKCFTKPDFTTAEVNKIERDMQPGAPGSANPPCAVAPGRKAQ